MFQPIYQKTFAEIHPVSINIVNIEAITSMTKSGLRRVSIKKYEIFNSRLFDHLLVWNVLGGG